MCIVTVFNSVPAHSKRSQASKHFTIIVAVVEVVVITVTSISYVPDTKIPSFIYIYNFQIRSIHEAGIILPISQRRKQVQ